MLTQTINAYPYQEYADDEDVQAIFDAYNLANQYYINWFSQIGLPDYTNLQEQFAGGGPATNYEVDPGLLDWVLTNLYGMSRPYFAISSGADIGPLNTAPLNTQVLGAYQFATSASYYVDDDWYQRIATWNLYAGDGKNFSMSWLKRRIMRFLLGINGRDPVPNSDQTTINDVSAGCESTYPVSVTVANVSGVRTMTITILASALSSMSLNLRSDVVNIFSVSLIGGALEMPVQYQYIVNIDTQVNVAFAGLPATYNTTQGSVAITPLTALPGGGTPPYTFDWSFIAGGVGISILNPTLATPTFDASLLAGERLSGIVQCLVTDNVGNKSVSTAPMQINNTLQPLSLRISPNAATGSGGGIGITTNEVTALMSGGYPAYTDLGWSFVSGGGGITIVVVSNTAGKSTAYFSGSPGRGNTLSGVCQVGGADSGMETALTTFKVTITDTF